MSDLDRPTLHYDDPLFDLLAEWKRRQHAGQSISAVELCQECPERVAELEGLIATLHDAEWMLVPLEETSDAKTSERGQDWPLVVGQPFSGDQGSGGEYRLVQRLGRGGSGEVWEAIGPGGFPVALKCLNDSTSANEQKALELVKKLRHPHLLAVSAAWRTGPWLVLVCELGETTLADQLEWHRQRGEVGIPPSKLLKFMHEAAEGLDYLNTAGIQHRDVKPQNLLLVGGSVKVADLGLLKELDSTHALNSTTMMTPRYAPPEFFDGKTTPWSDQYSLAISYCELRGGRLPFTGSSIELLRAHTQLKPDLSMLPERERPAVARALSKLPDERWDTCTAFAEQIAIALRNVLESPQASEMERAAPASPETQPESSELIPQQPEKEAEPEPTGVERLKRDVLPRFKPLVDPFLKQFDRYKKRNKGKQPTEAVPEMAGTARRRPEA